jgi:sensor histidine kinase regulating citrate/malate metabolism
MAGRFHQRGISMFMLLFVLVVIAGVGAMAMQAFPSMVEYQAALKAVNKAKDEGTVPAIRAAFDRAAQIDDINSITGKDLEITKSGDQVIVSFAYQKDFHMFGPAWLTLKYQGSSRPGR